jgi:hypothetical protein
MSKTPKGETPSNPFKAAWKEIDSFWFGFGSPVSLGIFRILLGLANLLNLCFLLLDFDAWFSERGYVPTATNSIKFGPMERNFVVLGHPFNLPISMPRLSLLELDLDRNACYQILDPRITIAFFIVVTLAALLTTLGLWTRVSSIVLALGVVTIQHRNTLILHGGDSVLRLAALYMAIAPSGAACSLDRVIALWKGRAPAIHRQISLWPQRLIQFNLALIYFTTWWIKMDGSRWRDGSAIWFPSQLDEFKRFWTPEFMHHPWVIPVLTYSTLGVELALGTIVFWKPARTKVLVLGLLMHAWIEYSMNIPLFAFGICSYYITFYSGEEITAWAHRMADRLKRWRLIVVTRTPLLPGPALALTAMDPFELVSYESKPLTTEALINTPEPVVVDSGGKKRSLAAVALRTLGAFPWGLLPGVWIAILRRATKPVATSEALKPATS